MIGASVRATVVLLLVFAAGMLTGVFVERHHPASRGSEIEAADLHEAAMTELRDVVGLDDAQIERVHAIMAEHQQVVQGMWEQLRPEVQSTMEHVHTAIGEELRSDQRQRFHDWLRLRHEQAHGSMTLIHGEQ